MTLAIAFEHGFVVHLVGACFDHNDLLAGTGNGQLKVGMLSLLLVRADDDFTIHQTNLHTADWTVPREYPRWTAAKEVPSIPATSGE